MKDKLDTFFEQLAGTAPAQRLLRHMGLKPRQFVLFLALFRTLSEREELTGGIGVNRFNLSYLALCAAGLGMLPWSLVALSGIPSSLYLLANLLLAFALTFLIMIREAASVLFNPVGSSVLAHCPVHSPTYTAAKIVHILLAVFYLISGLTLYPALTGIMLKGARWFWPATHFAAAVLIGLWTAFLICAFYGLLIRLLPAYRLKSISMWIQLIAFLSFVSVPIYFPAFWMWLLARKFEATQWTWLPLTWFAEFGLLGCHHASWRLSGTGALSIAASLLIIWLGLHSFSGIYLSESTAMVQGGFSKIPRVPILSRIYAAMICAATGSPLGLGAFAFVSRMIRRDWQFRRTVLMQAWLPFLIILVIGLMVARGSSPASPFGKIDLSFAHVLPHIMGLIALALCVNVTFTDFHSSAWVYLIAPVRTLRAFARGIYWGLWTPIAGIPHILMMPFLIRFWGWKEASLVTTFSLIVVSLYLGFGMILISGLPFSSPSNESNATKNVIHLQICSLIAMVVPATIHWALFLRWWITAIAGIILMLFTWMVVRWTLGELESAMAWKLHTMKMGKNLIFEEIG